MERFWWAGGLVGWLHTEKFLRKVERKAFDIVRNVANVLTTHRHTDTDTRTHARTHARTHTSTHTCKHARTHALTHTHTHTHSVG